MEKRSDLTTSTRKKLEALFHRHGYGDFKWIDPEKIVYIPYGLFDEEFNKNFGPREITFNVLFAGRFTEQKGVDYLEEIVYYLSKQKEFQAMKITVAGSGPLENDVIKLAEKHTNVEYIGFVKDMPGLYEKADLAIVLSRWEMFPYNCLEPQANSLPVVAFNIPGTQDIILDKITGRLIPLGNIEAFSQAVLDFFRLKRDDLDAWKEMREKARLNLMEKLAMPKIIEKMVSFFDKVRQGY